MFCGKLQHFLAQAWAHIPCSRGTPERRVLRLIGRAETQQECPRNPQLLPIAKQSGCRASELHGYRASQRSQSFSNPAADPETAVAIPTASPDRARQTAHRTTESAGPRPVLA